MQKQIFIYCLSVLVLISNFSSRAQTKVDKRFVGIEAEINKILKDNHAAGVAVAVVEKNKVNIIWNIEFFRIFKLINT